MNHFDTPDLKTFVEPRDAPRRLGRIWTRIEPQLAEQRSRPWWSHPATPWVSSAALALLVLAGMTWLSTPRQSAASNDSPPKAADQQGDGILEAGTSVTTEVDRMAFELSDGSELTVASNSDVKMNEMTPTRTDLTVYRGRVDCSVTPNPSREFLVHAGPVLVRVVGTRFSVIHQDRAGGQNRTGGRVVTVEVTEGSVQVTPPGERTHHLAAGERWSIALNDGPVATPGEPTEREPRGKSSGTDSTKRVDERPQPEPVGPKSAASPDEVFSRARELRNGGQVRAAAQQYAHFVGSFPSDPRVGLAALELARLRMDQLGDPAGALGPLRIAERATRGGLADDALARQVRALSQLGQPRACQETRARYLASYPSGVHRKTVEATCRP